MMKKQGKKHMLWTPKKIKELRARLGENQEEFARHFRVSVDALQHWEQGRGPVPGPIQVILESLETALGQEDESEQPASA